MAAWWQKIIPSKNDRELKRISGLVDQIASLEAKFKALPDASLQAKSTELRNRYMEAYKGFGGDPESRVTYGATPEATKLERKRIDDSLNPLLPEAFALCREHRFAFLGCAITMFRWSEVFRCTRVKSRK